MYLIRQIKNFYKKMYSAVTLLTVFPLPGWELDFNSTTHYFPWVGIILSVVYTAVYITFDGLVSPFMLAFIIVILDGFMTGGLHLDGFSDWIDGIYSRKEGDDLRAVLKDSNIGAIGAAGLIFLLLGKTFFLREILMSSFPFMWILFFPWFARILMYLVIVYFPYPAGKEGLGKICQEEYLAVGHVFAFSSGAILLVIMYIFSPAYFMDYNFFKLILAGLVAGILTYIFIKRLEVRLGGVNGDGYGASCEFSQLVVLFVGGIIV